MPRCYLSMALVIIILVERDVIIETLAIEILQSPLRILKLAKMMKGTRISSIIAIKRKNITFLNTLHPHLHWQKT